MKPRLVITLGVYLILRWLLLHVIGDGGVLTPEHAIERWRVAAALALLVMRLTILVAVPLVIGYRLTTHFIPWIASRLRTR